MDLKERAINVKDKISNSVEGRLERVENFISDRGVGSAQLAKAKRVQRDVNLAIAAGCLITVAGIAIWAFSSSRSNEEEDS